jgi:hypothetical protein
MENQKLLRVYKNTDVIIDALMQYSAHMCSKNPIGCLSCKDSLECDIINQMLEDLIDGKNILLGEVSEAKAALKEHTHAYFDEANT